MSKHYPRDPYWLTVKYSCQCSRCHAPLARGARAFYYPNGKSMLCAAAACGEKAAAEFHAAAADEAFTSGSNY